MGLCVSHTLKAPNGVKYHIGLRPQLKDILRNYGSTSMLGICLDPTLYLHADIKILETSSGSGVKCAQESEPGSSKKAPTLQPSTLYLEPAELGVHEGCSSN